MNIYCCQNCEYLEGYMCSVRHVHINNIKTHACQHLSFNKDNDAYNDPAYYQAAVNLNLNKVED